MPLKLRASGRAGVFGIRFHADGARAFLGIPMRGTSDVRIALDDLWPAEGTRLARAAAGARDHASRAAIAEQLVAERIAASAHEDDAVVRRSVFDVLERDTSRPWTEAALAAGYYDQSHFIREFRRFVGCTPSEFLRTGEGIAAALALP